MIWILELELDWNLIWMFQKNLYLVPFGIQSEICQITVWMKIINGSNSIDHNLGVVKSRTIEGTQKLQNSPNFRRFIVARIRCSASPALTIHFHFRIDCWMSFVVFESLLFCLIWQRQDYDQLNYFYLWFWSNWWLDTFLTVFQMARDRDFSETSKSNFSPTSAPKFKS